MVDEAEPSRHYRQQLDGMGVKWMERIRASEKREHRWRKDAAEAEKAYACDGDSKGSGKLYDFNILHSNVETIVPAIYNSTPIPDIRRRFVEAIGEEPAPPEPQPGAMPDPRQMMAFQQAAAEWQAKKQADEDAKNYGVIVERAIAVQIDDNRLDKEIEAEAQDAFLAGRGIVRVRFDLDEDGTGERVGFEVVSWRDYRQGPGKRWEHVPWVAFCHEMTQEELEKHKDGELYAAQGAEVPTADGYEEDECVRVWEIWCKDDGRVVKFVREHDARVLQIVEDPLGLPGFFPNPEPVQPISLSGKTVPVCPFTIYRKLADELDTITRRINAIMKGLKVKGLIAGDVSDISKLADADDNELVPVANLEGLAQTKGLEGAIAWWPVEQAVAVLKELYVQRDAVKESIYEITGISDIVRGASDAQETLGAQQIKTQWGSLRIQKMQRLIERQVRDLFVMAADLIVTKFSPQTLQEMSGIEITEGIAALMHQPRLRGYRIDVESDSTIRADLTRQKGEMTEFLAGTGQFFGTVGPLIQQAPAMGEPMAEIFGSFCRVFKLGKQAEDAIERMTQMARDVAKQPPPNPEAEAQQAEIEMKKAEFGMKKDLADQDMQNKREMHDLDIKAKMADLAATQQKNAMAAQAGQIKMQQDHAAKSAELQAQGLPALPDLPQMAMPQQDMTMADVLGQLMQALTAPKRIVKDGDGRPVGVETVLQ